MHSRHVILETAQPPVPGGGDPPVVVEEGGWGPPPVVLPVPLFGLDAIAIRANKKTDPA